MIQTDFDFKFQEIKVIPDALLFFKRYFKKHPNMTICCIDKAVINQTLYNPFSFETFETVVI
ncbi:MAG: hypothetical protein ACI8ZM_004141 [Crocinitomix sp.]|jgi:hypothetical protein